MQMIELINNVVTPSMLTALVLSIVAFVIIIIIEFS